MKQIRQRRNICDTSFAILVIFNDITTIKLNENQCRQTDKEITRTK